LSTCDSPQWQTSAFGSANASLIVHGREQASTEAATCNDETPLQ
jgi:hypothetical protein